MRERCYRYLFLDRDGVVNVRLKGDYVKTWEEFTFIEGVLEALQMFADWFDVIVIVTNQQGVGKGVMTEENFLLLSEKMQNEIAKHGGRIDKVYFCPSLAKENNVCRKPNVGMGLKARKDFPNIRFKESVMVGDSFSDMEFGKRLGMHTVLVGESVHLPGEHPRMIDEYHEDLISFAKSFEKNRAKK